MTKKVIWNLVKLNNQDKIVFIKCGAFYNTYLEDSKIISKIFGYKLIHNRVGFPKSSLEKIISTLNDLGKNSLVIDKE